MHVYETPGVCKCHDRRKGLAIAERGPAPCLKEQYEAAFEGHRPGGGTPKPERPGLGVCIYLDMTAMLEELSKPFLLQQLHFPFIHPIYLINQAPFQPRLRL
jgi:hypothetical protein